MFYFYKTRQLLKEQFHTFFFLFQFYTGSPLIQKSTNKLDVLIGIAIPELSSKEHEEDTAFFFRVSSELEWIKSIVAPTAESNNSSYKDKEL